ncbi:TPA: hypothetical protein ACGOYL_001098 [Streptococcus suis]|uniref:Uncharacterized protein n=2 Tax=Streptococcus TaxID=1301 RepID=A0A6L8MUV7_STRSU|nr:hypothetical protein [Streptococcus parasuis]MCQ8267748.1 hypothetical protein [Streptococcus suis]MYN68954.1 hypothetical protein [Streptococcus suis]NQK94639.1 hypothetical protein [Streptococcus suis]NQM12586.1 hypothetical protein [Streptococcus suis]NQM55208.1 hypothetical protein [Streptococcus suis]
MKRLELFFVLLLSVSLFLPFASAVDTANLTVVQITGWKFFSQYPIVTILTVILFLLLTFQLIHSKIVNSLLTLFLGILVIYLYSIPLGEFAQLSKELLQQLPVGYYASALLVFVMGALTIHKTFFR